MAKKSMLLREVHRKQIAARCATKRAELKSIIKNIHLSDEERYTAQQKLQALPRDASPTRQRNRCAITGRPRGVYRKFGLGRNMLRILAMRGDIPGMVKSSW